MQIKFRLYTFITTALTIRYMKLFVLWTNSDDDLMKKKISLSAHTYYTQGTQW